MQRYSVYSKIKRINVRFLRMEMIIKEVISIILYKQITLKIFNYNQESFVTNLYPFVTH